MFLSKVILGRPKKIKEPETPFNLTENYGKVPKYIHQVKNAINEEYDAIRTLMQAQQEAALKKKIESISGI